MKPILCSFARLRLAALGAASLLALAGFARTAPPATPTPAATPSQPSASPTVKAFLQSNCVDCHDGETQKGAVRLDNLAWNPADPAISRQWAEVHDMVATGQMPPKKQAQPVPAAKQQFLSALSSQLTAADLTARKADGRVVLRRLNRTEYENTIRDLLDVEVDLKDLLPEDGSALGFDNVADALSVSSVLMERYLESADVALDAAIQTGPKPESKTWDVSMAPVTNRPDDYRLKTGVRELQDGTFIFFGSSGETPIVCDRFKVQTPGVYRVKVTAYAYQSEKPLTMCIIASTFDARAPRKSVVGYFEVPPDASKPRTIEFTERFASRGTIKILAFETGRSRVPGDMAKEYTGPGVAVTRVHAEGPLAPEWPPAAHKKLFGDLDFKTATIDDAERILTAFASRAFRRPATKAEIAPYVALVKEKLASIPPPPPAPARQKNKPVYVDPKFKTPFELSIRVGLKAILCSPEFLFLREKPGQLDDYAIASRLSYFLWSSTPDDELMKLAGSGTLRKPDVLRQQTERLLKDPRAAAFTENFTGQWLNLRQIDFTTPDKQLYPEFDSYLQWSMVEETRRFFDEVLGKDLNLLNFVKSDFTFLNGRLARHYGIEGVTQTEPKRVPLSADTHRGGVLTQGAVLKVTANGTTTSPVVRGAWVLRNILGQQPKPPPPNVPAVEPDIRGATTIREQLDKHREIGACASCHLKIDPPGNALERFDVIGGWRDVYRTAPGKDTKGKFEKIYVNENVVRYKFGPNVNPADKLPDGREFKDFEQFRDLLMSNPDQLARNLTDKLMVYSTGGGLDFADRPAVEAVIAKAKAKNYGFRTLVHEVVQSPVFLNK